MFQSNSTLRRHQYSKSCVITPSKPIHLQEDDEIVQELKKCSSVKLLINKIESIIQDGKKDLLVEPSVAPPSSPIMRLQSNASLKLDEQLDDQLDEPFEPLIKVKPSIRNKLISLSRFKNV